MTENVSIYIDQFADGTFRFSLDDETTVANHQATWAGPFDTYDLALAAGHKALEEALAATVNAMLFGEQS